MPGVTAPARTYFGPCWLVYGLPGAGVRLVIDESTAQFYADEGYVVELVYETESVETTATRLEREERIAKAKADGTWKPITLASLTEALKTEPLRQSQEQYLFADLARRTGNIGRLRTRPVDEEQRVAEGERRQVQA